MSKKDTLRVGVIGGGFGRVHILGFQECENVKVTAFCQRTKDKAEKLASEFKIPNVFTDYKDLISYLRFVIRVVHHIKCFIMNFPNRFSILFTLYSSRCPHYT